LEATLGKTFSIYLDLVRFVAACLVYVHHSNRRLLVHDILPFSEYGHSLVIVFFVLSGFVIAFVTDTKERDWAAYAASRISRIYSVAVPAVLLTVALDAVGTPLYPEMYGYPFDHFFLRVVGSLLLLNETWFVAITSFSNVPYWSICYEMWYYAAFGCMVFLPRRAALWAVALLALVLGPKIVLLAPVWGMGVILYRWQRLQHIPQLYAWLLVVGSWVGIFVFHWLDVDGMLANGLKSLIGEPWHIELNFSKFFLSDYLLGILVFLNFAGMRRVSDSLAPVLLRLERPIRWLASYTLSLYLLHQPLLLFWAAVLRGDPSGHGYWALTTALVAVSVWAIGWATENKRHVFKRWLEQRLIRAQAHFFPPHAAKN
jgi:peptidoglycan/LPS O-acetylase OafA/YrhL